MLTKKKLNQKIILLGDEIRKMQEKMAEMEAKCKQCDFGGHGNADEETNQKGF